VKQSFQLDLPARARERWLDASKHIVRKYVARQRRAPLPAGTDYWDFACRFGSTEQSATEVHFATLIPLMDAAAGRGENTFFVSIRGHAAVRGPRGKAPGDTVLSETDRQTAPQ
jgi:hypothetical protein